MGSGALVGRDLILTARHVVNGNPTPSIKSKLSTSGENQVDLNALAAFMICDQKIQFCPRDDFSS